MLIGQLASKPILKDSVTEFIRCSSSPPILDRHQNAGEKHEEIGQDEHHRVDGNRLLGHGYDAVSGGAGGDWLTD